MSRHALAVRWPHHPHWRRDAFPSHVVLDLREATHLQPRAESTTSSDSCKNDENSPECEKPVGTTNSVPIILGSLIPILCAIVVLVLLHRRHTRRLKREDAMDKTKSMDFGMDIGPARSATLTGLDGEKTAGHSRHQMSLDIDVVATPYLMPNVTHSSDSLARTVHSVEDRYGRPPRSPTHYSQPKREASLGRDFNRDAAQSYADQGLLEGAQRTSTSSPPVPQRALIAPPSSRSPPIPQINVPSPPRMQSPPALGLLTSPRDGRFTQNSDKDTRRKSPPTITVSNGLPGALQIGSPREPPRGESPFADPPEESSHVYHQESARPVSDDQSEYSEGIQFRFSQATMEEDEESVKAAPEEQPQPSDRKSLAPVAVDARRLSMGFRPLPPEGKPDDTAEERAMRIRSFYKEYFSVEDSAPPPMPVPPANYNDEYSQEYTNFDDTAIYETDGGRFIVPGSKPFAEPPTRRAMTPPPRMPPRFNNGPGSRAGSATGGRFMPPGPRSYSSVSGRLPIPPRARRPMAPPKPLHVLPTPSMVSEDAFADPNMFAPRVRIHRDGDVDSLRGGLRPYSPSVSPHIPLASSFDDLASIPSPHSLRRSGTFTALDFAPPRKFRNETDMSDAGSIRSNQSGMTAMHLQSIRSGAYRVSRLPTGVVPLKHDMGADLKPTWDMGYGKQS